jgi:hypothetical protein
MGKCKKRTLNKNVLGSALSRDRAVSQIVEMLKINKLDNETRKLISLFGITREELTEAGATFEQVLILKEIQN